MKIGVFGGSFDPIHRGHELLAKEAIRVLGLEKLICVVANVSPFKVDRPPLVDGEHRLEMVRLALEGIEGVEVSSLEVDRGGVSFTIDTVKTLKEAYRDEKFYLILSEDAVESFSRFKDVELIKNQVEVVFMVNQEKPFQKEGMTLIPVQRFECSSTMVRARLMEGQDCQDFLSPKVLDYISHHKLYSKVYDNG